MKTDKGRRETEKRTFFWSVEGRDSRIRSGWRWGGGGGGVLSGTFQTMPTCHMGLD